MLIALLVVLGVDLAVVIAFAALVLGRRRRLKRQPGGFAGAIRVSSGTFDPLGPEGVKRPGDQPVGIGFASCDAEIEVVTSAESRELAAGPLTLTPTAVSKLSGV